MKKTVYVLGNPVVPSDGLPLKIVSKLQKRLPEFSFVHFDPTEEINLETQQELILIDTVIGIKQVTKFDNLKKFLLSPRVSVHDFDLSVSLRLLEKLGKIKKVTIIGMPTKGKLPAIISQVENILKSI
ncbi:hypothetical protein FJY90_01290 [Candidatus Gottesmanbacteria bacterium]|nr:hypothetical protein [Candidatus Gottesmanbacteria bacterium]